MFAKGISFEDSVSEVHFVARLLPVKEFEKTSPTQTL